MSGEKSYQKLFWSFFIILLLAFIFSFATQAAKLTDRKLIISDSRESLPNIKYTFYWTGSTTTLKCIKILFCDTWTGACNTPAGFNSNGAAKGIFSGLTADNWALNNSTNGTLKLTNSAGEAPATDVSLEFLGITNPSNAKTYYSRIETFSNEDCSGPVDSGIVSFTITGPGISVTVTVPGVPPPPPPPGVGVPAPTKVVFEGRAYPKAFLTILRDGAVAATFFAEPSGLFKKELTGIKAGIYTFGIFAEDTEKRKSVTLSFTTGILEGMTTTISGIFISPTIELSPPKVGRGEVLNIFGQVFPESRINIFVSPKEIVKETISSPKGKWSYALDTGFLEEGEYAVRAKALFEKGEQSPFSQTLSFSVITKCQGADLNFDGKVNIIDFSILLYFWGQKKPANICADINFDGIVNIVDFSIMMYYWTG